MALKDSDNIQLYIVESLEHLADIENDLLQIEKCGTEIDETLVNKVFRTAHSVKGGAGFLGFKTIKEVAHKMENVLGLIRSRKLVPDSEVINILLKSADSLNNLLANIEESKEADVSELVEQLLAFTQGERETIAKPASHDKQEQVIVAAGTTKMKLSAEEARQTERDQVIKSSTTADSNKETKIENRSDKAVKKKGIGFETSLRVNIKLLDSLMTMASEMVLSRNQLLKAMAEKDYNAAESVSQRIDLITSDLQELVMLTRMQPIGKVFQRFPRLVRDQARELGKEVDLILEGEDVELDKTIIEAISDPLTHLVRNAIDHGIESPAERQQQDKRPSGRVMIRAYHEAGQIFLDVQDDGKGLDVDKLTAEAVASGHLLAEQVGLMSEKEKLHLIFSPGFSTASTVTELSGRGVGMDVVKTNLDRLGGQIDIISWPGQGCTFRIKIPLTLAIISSQIIVDGEERYAIPQVNLLELIRISADQVKHRVEVVGDAPVLRLRGRLLPLLKLHEVLGSESTHFDSDKGMSVKDRRRNIADPRSKKFKISASVPGNDAELTEWQNKRILDDRRRDRMSALKIALLDTGVLQYGLIVDRLLDSEEIVVKSLGRHLKSLSIFAGATIMGDGRVSLILDVARIAREAGLTSLESTDRFQEVIHESEVEIRARKDMQALLVFRGDAKEHFAVPLSLVERVIKIRADTIQEVGGQTVIKYQDRSLPVFTINQVARVSALPAFDDYLVLLFSIAGHDIGLLATSPVNAVEITMAIDDQTHRQVAIMGSVIINEQITLLVDVYDLIRTLHPEWFSQQMADVEKVKGKTILFAEDSEFFRVQVSQFMEEEGFAVIKAEDGEAAWELLQKHQEDIGLVVTDIEMPRLDGFGLVKRIKQNHDLAGLPVIALTTLAGADDRARGKDLGLADYLIKLDKEKLLESIFHHLETVTEDS